MYSYPPLHLSRWKNQDIPIQRAVLLQYLSGELLFHGMAFSAWDRCKFLSHSVQCQIAYMPRRSDRVLKIVCDQHLGVPCHCAALSVLFLCIALEEQAAYRFWWFHTGYHCCLLLVFPTLWTVIWSFGWVTLALFLLVWSLTVYRLVQEEYMDQILVTFSTDL